MSQDQKQQIIIEAAIKRFAHFGVGKTTMSEIAADLSISKASLYYYFPDKLNLYAEVLRTITGENEKADEEELLREKDPFRAINIYLEKRTDFIIRYHNILEFLKTYTPSQIPAELAPMFNYWKKRQLRRLTAIIQSGVDSGIFLIKDVTRIGGLFFDFLEGFRYNSLVQSTDFFPDKKQFLAILKREKEFSLIFLNGLTIKGS